MDSARWVRHMNKRRGGMSGEGGMFGDVRRGGGISGEGVMIHIPGLHHSLPTASIRNLWDY